ncbi:MAG: IreB family regulatory phosphoprotein [Clostridia bacterium]|nr:IreB family regulatory phosphoprotein [Clostridia bacterium]
MEEKKNTMTFERPREQQSAHDALVNVYKAVKEKGYNPINQIVGYLLCGDPAYITSYKNARSIICKFERDELIEELVKSYMLHNVDKDG